MADQKPTSNFYKLLGGVNQKASLYELSLAQFLDLRNMDFDVPNALQKRPGQTYGIGSSNGTSGPISSIYEYIKLNGQSFIVLGSDTAMFYVANNGYTILDTGWNNGQPADMLTFTNNLYIANGQKWKRWNGSSLLPMGLPIQNQANVNLDAIGFTCTYLFGNTGFANSNASYILVNGATMILASSGGTIITRGIYMAYAYLRNDGYVGPADFQLTARNLVYRSAALNTGDEIMQTPSWNVNGFTVPAGYGISGIGLWFAEDTIYNTGPLQKTEYIPGIGTVNAGDLGWIIPSGTKNFCSLTLKPGADLSRFYFFTTIAGASLYLTNNGSATFWSATNIIFGTTFSNYDGVPVNGFSGMVSDFFASYIPKYIEINNNSMFASGFSVGPSTVKFSNVGEPEFYEPDNTFEIRTNDGDRILGQMAYNGQMIFGKENSFHKLVGDSAVNYQLVQVTDQYGVLSQKTMLQKDSVAYWLDKKGILEYNGANFQIVSGAVEGIFRRMNISAAKEKAVGVHHRYRNQLWWGIPIDGATQNNITVVYDYMIGAWTFFDGFNPSSFGFIKGALTKPTAWRGDYSGMIHYFGESFCSDSGAGITCLAFTRFDAAKENETWIWRRFFLDAATASGLTGTINVKAFSNYDTSTVQATFSMFQDQFQYRTEMGVVGKAVAAQFSHFSASLPLLINGYSWAKRRLRNV